MEATRNPASPAEAAPREPREADDDEAGPPPRWGLSLVLIALTFVTTTNAGALLWPSAKLLDVPYVPFSVAADFVSGFAFSVPLMAILLAHEFGHYIAGRLHHIAISTPYFIPVPGFLLGTMGAVIRMHGTIRSRSALLDVGAAGPLAGLAIALPVLAYGIVTSPVEPVPAGGGFLLEGRSLLYAGMLLALKGPIPAGHDIFLTPTAFAGWAGLLVTMINLLPVGQLDGGHIAYAAFGPRQNRYSERIRLALPTVALVIGVVYAARAHLAGADQDRVMSELFAGVHWLVWAGLLWWMTRVSGPGHPPTEPGELTPGRRWVARATLLLFVLLFMPSWVRAG